MVFSSLVFLYAYLAAVILLYYLLPRKARNAFLLAVNLVFYFCGEPVYIVLMLGSIAANYGFGRLIDRPHAQLCRRKAALVCGIVFDLALLCIFKYTGFFAGILSKIPVFSALPRISIPLPVGISFYTFQTMSYLIDVYRRDVPCQKNVLAFGNYVALFPQLIAGPIVRYRDVAGQLESRRESLEKISSGALLFVCGLAKKVLIANAMGQLWAALAALDGFGGTIGALGAAFAFSFQLYFDFSGYSDMARGLGRIFGFEFLENFNYPYISKSITEFWRRWHISLGTWFREYVYIPLGGNRCAPARQALNLAVVWLLTGLWHGASWNFVIWGAYYGLLLILEKFLMKKIAAGRRPVLGRIYTLSAVLFGWVIFAFDSMPALGGYLSGLFGACGLLAPDAAAQLMAYLPLLVAAAFASTPCARTLYGRIRSPWLKTMLECAGVAAVMLLATAALVYNSYNPFLYFRF
jgi:alginate O-acetyltransferase complex protein AlgI